MSEEIIERLRANPLWPTGAHKSLTAEAADRIAELEAEIERMTPQFVAYEYLESPAGREIAEARLSEAVKVLEEVTKALGEFTSQAPTMLSCGRHCTAEVEHMEEEAYASAHNHAAFQLRQAKAFLATIGEENGH